MKIGGVAKKVLVVAGFGLGLTMLSGEEAHALTASDNLSVTASVANVCSIVGGNLAFGAYNSGAATSGSGTISVNCTTGANVTVDLANGQNFGLGNNAALRAMTNGTSFMSYGLYQDAGFTTAWGSGANSMAHTGAGSATNLTVHGQIPAGQTVTSGAYVDTVVATVNY